MKKIRIFKIISAVMSAVMIVSGVPAAAPTVPAMAETRTETNQLKLWYDSPASKGTPILEKGGYGTTAEDNQWQQFTLPIGNSYMGANVYGEIANERLTFNHKTLWNGGPSESRPDYNGGNLTTSGGKSMSTVYQEVVQAFLEGKANASNLCNSLVGGMDGYGAYQSWGDIYLTFEGLTDTTATTGYERNLDFETAIANVDFGVGGTRYHREYFISYPDQILAMRLTAEGRDSLNLNVRFPVDNAENVTASKLGKNVTYTVNAENGTIVTAGSMQDNQMKMNSMLKVVTEGTVTASSNESLHISGAEEVVIFVAADTDYKNEYPLYRTGETDEELAKSVADTVDLATKKGYDAVKQDHLKDYQELFGRLTLDLGQTETDKPTDDLLAAYKNGSATDGEARLLEVLLYQYGRYLTVASSRNGDLPSNLQGVWQNRVGDAGRVPWGSDYHLNVNLQMNYWPTYSSNLAECALPLIDYVDSLREPGRVTAAAYFGIESAEGEENGFTAHTQNNPFGWTCPGWDFSWGWSPAAVPWILQNCWEYYEYTGDTAFLKERIYPMLKEEAILYDQLLVDSGTQITLEDGSASTRLVSAPTYSPEHGPRTLGNAYEQTLIWQLYEDSITAAETLGVDEALVKQWKETQSRLSPIEIGDSGQIKEWYHETTLGSVGERQHRHMSHLLGLFPGDLISLDNDTYMDAAIISLTDRGMKSTGWGMGQRINAWARTGQGEKAYQLIQTLFNDGIYPNLWDTHAPFQIDGNFGYTSGVNEMLMQSNMGYINILPALPDVWNSGSVEGIVARGNFELDITWKDGTADKVTVLANNGGTCTMQYSGIRSAVVTDSKGKEVDTTVISRNRISFETAQGGTYTITEFDETSKGSKEKVTELGPKSEWTATAGSEENNGNDGPASWAIDGRNETWWHSCWTDNARKAVIADPGERNDFTIDFGKTVSVGRLEYIPRDTIEGNGFITQYDIYYSTTANGDDFKLLVKGGTWAYDTSTKKVDFEENTDMRRMRIYATGTNGGWGPNMFISAGEFNLYHVEKETSVPPDNTELKKAVADAERISLKDYPSEITESFVRALSKARKVLSWEDATQKELDRACQSLNKARASLIEAGNTAKTEAAGKLKALVQKAKKVKQDNYTEKTIKRFRKALEEANRVLADKNATWAQVDSALHELEASQRALKAKPVPAKGTMFNAGVLRYKVITTNKSGGTVQVVKQIKKKAALTIPNTVVKNGYTFKVTQIKAKAFQNNKKLKSVVIGANVNNIGAKSFLKCSKLKSIIFKNTKAPKIGTKAFKGIKATCKIKASKKMKKKQFNLLKKRMKSAGKKVKFTKK